MKILFVIAASVTIETIGIGLISLLPQFKNKPLLEKLGYSYGVGFVSVCFQMLLYSFSGISWTLENLFIPWIFYLIAICFRSHLKIKFPRMSIQKIRGFSALMLVLIVFNLFFVVFSSLIRPITAWDSWATWLLGGKAFFLAKHIDPTYIRYANTSNPPLFHLFLSYIFMFLGSADDQISVVPLITMYLSLVIVFFYSLRQFKSLDATFFFTFLLVTTPNIIRHAGRFDVGNADLPLAYFIFFATILSYDYIRKKLLSYLILAELFFLAAALTKSEGVPLFLFANFFLLIITIKRQNYARIFFLLPPTLLLAGWQIFKIHNHLPANPFLTGNVYILRTPNVLLAMTEEVLNIGRWNFLWISFFPIVAWFIKKQTIFLTMLVYFQLFVYLLIYLMTPVDPISHIHNSFDRLLLHLSPVALFLTALALSEKQTKCRIFK